MNTLQICLWGLQIGAIYGLIALAFVLVYKATKVINFAQGSIVMLTVYLCHAVISLGTFPIWAGLLLSAGVAIGLGLAINRLFMHPLVGQPLIAPVMVTIALMGLIQGLCIMVWGDIGGCRNFDPLGISAGALHIGQIVLLKPHTLGFIVTLVLFGLCALFFKYAKLGLGMRATAEDHQVAKVLGVPVMFVFAAVWALATLISLVAGFILGSMNGLELGIWQIGIKAIAVALIGGLESIPGALIAGLMVGVLEQLAGAYIDPYIGGGLMDVFPLIIMCIIIYFRPYGLFGLERIERV